MTDDTQTIRITADQVKETIKQAPHLAPIHQAVLKHDAHVLLIKQDTNPFDPPEKGRPWIVFIQDDPKPGKLSLGPDGFDRGSLEAAIKASSVSVVMACEPITELYARAASAAIDHSNVVFIETWLTHEDQWTSLIKETKPDIKLLVGSVRPGRA